MKQSRMMAPMMVGAAALAACSGSISTPSSTSPTKVEPDAALPNDSGTVDDATTDAGADGGHEADGNAPSTGTDASATASADGGVTLPFASGADWGWFGGDLDGADGGSLGTAVDVCVTPSVPANCPTDAVIYETSGSGWGANITPIPGARWIWRGDVTSTAIADLQFAVFQKTFVLGAAPAGTIQIAADDYAEVRVNGNTVGSTGSVTDESAAFQAQSSLKTIDLGSYLVEGANTITIVGQNGPASFAGGACSPCTYSVNTAGVLFGGTLTSR
jgi:hypothetical protein